MIRVLASLIGVLILAVGVALARQAMLYARIDRIMTTLTALQVQLEPVTPVDTLCTLSLRLDQMYAALGARCGDVGTLPPLTQPVRCAPYRIQDVPPAP